VGLKNQFEYIFIYSCTNIGQFRRVFLVSLFKKIVSSTLIIIKKDVIGTSSSIIRHYFQQGLNRIM